MDAKVDVMSENPIGSRSSSDPSGDTSLVATDRRVAERRSVAPNIADDTSALAQRDREQLARDFAEIERAAAILRKAEPALESWTQAPATTGEQHPVWLLIALLWFSSALVTVGAVVAFAAFVG
jgi:hypothetical protein